MKDISPADLARIVEKYGKDIPGLRDELDDRLARRSKPDAGGTVSMSLPEALPEIVADDAGPTLGVVRERIVAVTAGARPVARIRQNQVTTEFIGPDSQSWAKVIETSKKMIDQALPAVGRIELNNSDYPWAGTGWLVAPGIVVTNRHVATVFAKLDPKTSRPVFKSGLMSGLVSADIDFLEEENRLDSAEHPLTSILWVAPAKDGDVAFLRVTQASDTAPLPKPIDLAEEAIEPESIVAAIGYPARDPSIRDQSLVIQIFGDDVYEKKRLAPGKVIGIDGNTLKHDCSTLGGNSGSVILDLKTGKAVGLHHGGLIDDSANLAVTAAQVKLLLARALSEDRNRPEDPGPTETNSAKGSLTETEIPGSYRLKLFVPVEITVRVGSPQEEKYGTQVVITPATKAGPDDALRAAKERFMSLPDVLDIRKGYRFKNGWITDERVIVIEVHEKLGFGELERKGTAPFPREILGVGVDVRTGALPDQLDFLGLDSIIVERPGKPAGYQEPAGYDDPDAEMHLGRVKERMSAIFHVSPDAGFKNLKNFLGRVEKNLTATMYEWEPNHISDAIEKAMTPAGRSLRMVTQKHGVGEKDATEEAVDDMKERVGKKFKHVWASVRGPNRLIQNSYHIKVAVRDSEEMWLSSGNWKDSNQPKSPVLPAALQKSNREWHAIIKNDRLAKLFKNYIEYDFEQATRFPLAGGEAPPFADIELFVPDQPIAAERVPQLTYASELVVENEELDIQPLLTPDRDAQGARIFMRVATEMVKRATTKLYIQNQSFNLTDENNEEFDEFFMAVRAKQKTIDDVKIIFRDARDYGRPDDIVEQQELIERLKDLEFDVSVDAVRVQPKCHTKGIIVDSKEVLLGSQNLTNLGSLFNRDASLLVRSPKVAEFFEKIFLYDWENLAHNQVDEVLGGIRRAGPGEETPPGYRRVKLSELLNDD